MLTFKEDIKDTQIYLGLRKKVGWIELNPVQAQRALDNKRGKADDDNGRKNGSERVHSYKSK